MEPILEKASLNISVLTREGWESKMRAVRRSGSRMAQVLIKEEGRHFMPKILATLEGPGSDETHVEKTQLTAVIIPLDWKVETRLAMVELANDFLTKAYSLDSLDSSLQSLLAATIEGRIAPEAPVPIL